MNFAERVRELRMRMGLSQAKLAERAAVTTQTVSLWERGQRYPTEESLSRLADYFNVHIEYLTGESDDDSPQQDLDDAARRQEIEADLQELAMMTMRLSKLSAGMRQVIAATLAEAYKYDRDNDRLSPYAGTYDISIGSTLSIMDGREPVRNQDYPKSMEPQEWSGEVV